jgi:phage tail sheath protein FI
VRPNVPLRTLTGGAHGAADWGWLATRRLAFFIVNSVERGTRWVLGSARDRTVWLEVTRQVQRFLDQLHEAGAFPGRDREDAFSIVCDERINKESELAAGNFHILLQFAAVHSAEHHAFMITHSTDGSRVRRVRMNPHNVNALPPSVASMKTDDGIPVLKMAVGDLPSGD